MGSCGVGTYTSLVSSFDAGRNWTSATWPSRIFSQPCGSGSELVALSPTREALLAAVFNNGSQTGYDVLFSDDNGATWHAVSIPAPLWEPDSGNFAYAWPTMLPDGSLLGTGATRWLILPPGARHWCLTQRGGLPPWPANLMVVGDQLWVFDTGDMRGGTTLSYRIPLSQLKCATS
jgi:hypothetical protein